MGLLSTLNNFRLRLSSTERETIWRAFGSFYANKMAMDGNNLIKNSYEKNVDIYAIIKKIVDVTSSIDWVIEEITPSGEVVRLENTTLHELINSPNNGKKYSWNNIEEQLLIYLLCTGNAYLFGQTGLSNLIVEVDVLPTNNVCIKSNNDFFMPEWKYDFSIDNKKYTFTNEEIAHIKLFNPAYSTIEESYYGLSPIAVASMVVQTSNDRVEADAALLQNRGAIGLITDKSNRPMTGDEARKVQDSWNNTTAGTHNFGKIKVTNKDLSYIQMAMSSTDLQLIEKGVVNTRTFCNLFGLDSSLFNDPENKTYNNRLEAEKAMYTNAIMPLSDRIAEVLTNFLCKNHFPNRNVYMRQDFSNIEVLQENFEEKARVYTMLKLAGIITANTAAEALRQPVSLDENANKLIVSNSNVLLSDINKTTTTNDTAQ